jgi:hypothetical protein
MDDTSLAQRLVEAVVSDFDHNDPTKRPIHTIGLGVDGYFEASSARSANERAHERRRSCPGGAPAPGRARGCKTMRIPNTF